VARMFFIDGRHNEEWHSIFSGLCFGVCLNAHWSVSGSTCPLYLRAYSGQTDKTRPRMGAVQTGAQHLPVIAPPENPIENP
jgi:hypothetical protein